jgi:hypothetical protein
MIKLNDYPMTSHVAVRTVDIVSDVTNRANAVRLLIHNYSFLRALLITEIMCRW